jgi:hypothetical protein
MLNFSLPQRYKLCRIFEERHFGSQARPCVIVQSANGPVGDWTGLVHNRQLDTVLNITFIAFSYNL